jgi:hypothetical protein
MHVHTEMQQLKLQRSSYGKSLALFASKKQNMMTSTWEVIHAAVTSTRLLTRRGNTTEATALSLKVKRKSYSHSSDNQEFYILRCDAL